MSSKARVRCCAACPQTISDSFYAVCTTCNKSYDLVCASISRKSFLAMSKEDKASWKCQECLCKLPRNDNSNTPVRSEYNAATAKASSTCQIQENDEKVTLRAHQAQRNPKKKNEHPTKSSSPQRDTCVSPALTITAITAEDVRQIFREEMLNLKLEMLYDLNASLKQTIIAEIKPIQAKVDSMESSLEFLNEAYENTKTKVNVYQDTVNTLMKQKEELNETVRDLSYRLETMEQFNLSSNMEIQGVPEHKNESLPEVIERLSKVVSCALQESDVHLCTRTGKINKSNDRPRTIIVKLANARLRDTFLAQARKFNKANKNDKINTGHIGLGGKKQPVFVTEHLSHKNRSLHAAARLKAKELNFKFVWVKQGKVFMRKTETSDYVYVRDRGVLDKLI